MAVPSARQSELRAYLKRHKLQGKTVQYETQRDAGLYTVLLYGKDFQRASDARNEIKTLPLAVQRSKPWVRRYGSLQDIYRPAE